MTRILPPSKIAGNLDLNSNYVQNAVTPINANDLVRKAYADSLPGIVGATGPSGAAGANGAVGPTGPSGSGGATGPSGAAGSQGATGPAGSSGALPFKTVGFTAGMDYVVDGTNDEVQINAAIATLPAGGGRIILGPGSYSATGIVLSKVIKFEGAGVATVLNCNSGICITVTTVSCEISNILFWSTGGASGNIAIQARDSVESNYHDIRIYGFYTGLDIIGGLTNFISNFKINNCTYSAINLKPFLDGITVGTEAIISHGNIWGEYGLTDCGILNIGYHGCIISDVDIIGCVTDVAIVATLGTGIGWNYFNNCMFDTATAWGLYLQGTGAAYVVGVFLDHCWISSNAYGININNNVDSVNFSNCQILNNTNAGALIQGTNIGTIRFIGGMISCNGAHITNQVNVYNASFIEFGDIFFGPVQSLHDHPLRHISFDSPIVDGWVHGCHFSNSPSVTLVTDGTGGTITYTGNDPTVP